MFLDASVLLAAEDLDDPHHEAAKELIEGEEPLGTLELAGYETINVAIRAWKRPDAAERLQQRVGAIEQLGKLVRMDQPVLTSTGEIAEKHSISAYDAAYAAAARSLGAQLVSCDQRDLISNGLAVLPGDALEGR